MATLEQLLAEQERRKKPDDVAQPVESPSELDVLIAEQEKRIGAATEPAEPMPEGGAFEAITEPAIAIGSAAAGQVASGLAGTAVLPFKGLEGAAETVEDVQESFREFGAPETLAGQRGLETVGGLIEKGVDLARIPLSGLAGIGELIAGQGLEQAAETIRKVQDEGFGKTVGDRVFEETNSPILATVAEISPEILGSIVPLKAMAVKRSALNKTIADKIKAGSTENKLAKYTLTGSGKVKVDPVAQKAISNGFDSGVITAVKGSSGIDKTKMLNMLDIKKRGKENTLFAVKNRPADVAGNSLIERINFIKKINRDAGKKIDVEANLLRGQRVDFTGPVDNFIDNLDEMGISLDRHLKPVFKGSDIEGLAAPENAIKHIVNRLSSGKRGQMPSAYDLHRMKRFIDETVTFGKAGEGLTGKTERILKQLRADLDNTLDTNFPAYNQANTVYSETIGAIDALQGIAGKKMDLTGVNASKATGTLLRRMMSNAQSRINLVDAVDDLENLSRKYGGGFDDDISLQMLFADELDSVFGAAAKTSLQGDVAKSVQAGIDAAAGGKSMLGRVADVAKTGAKKVLGPDEDKAFKLMKELLERE